MIFQREHTTVSVTNGVGVHARGLELDCGIELEKLRNRPGCRGWQKGLRRARRPSRNKERLGIIPVVEEKKLE